MKAFVAVFYCRVNQNLGAQNISQDEGGRIDNRPVDVRLGGKVYYSVAIGNQLIDQLAIANIALDEFVVRTGLDLFEIFQVTGISQRIKIDNLVIRMVFQPITDEIRTDESGAAGNEQLHIILRLIL